MNDDVTSLGERLTTVGKSVSDVHARIDTFHGDMHQRFRVVNDRLASIEKRNAA